MSFKKSQSDIDEFVSIDISPRNLDRWITRLSIRDSLRSCYSLFHGEMLDIGCGKMPYKSEILQKCRVSNYTGLDLEQAIIYDAEVRPDAIWDGKRIPFPDNSFDCAMATEVFEHVPDIDLLFGELHRVLKPDGILFFTTPFVWPYHEVPHDCQRWTEFGLKMRFAAAGFHDEKIVSEGNWHSAFALFVGLWAVRSPMPRILRKCIRYPVFWLQKFLMKFDSDSQPSEASFPRFIFGTVRA